MNNSNYVIKTYENVFFYKHKIYEIICFFRDHVRARAAA